MLTPWSGAIVSRLYQFWCLNNSTWKSLIIVTAVQYTLCLTIHIHVDSNLFAAKVRGGTSLWYIGSGTKYTEISRPGRVGSVTRMTHRYRPTIVLCCINRKIHYRSIKLGHLAILARCWELSNFIHAKTVKFIKVYQGQATATVVVSTGYLCKHQLDLPIVVTKQRIVLYLQ